MHCRETAVAHPRSRSRPPAAFALGLSYLVVQTKPPAGSSPQVWEAYNAQRKAVFDHARADNEKARNEAVTAALALPREDPAELDAAAKKRIRRDLRDAARAHPIPVSVEFSSTSSARAPAPPPHPLGGAMQTRVHWQSELTYTGRSRRAWPPPFDPPRADYVRQVEAAIHVKVDVACLDLGTANMFALHALDGRRAHMTQGEFRAIAKLDSHEEAARHWDKRANLPTLPEIRRPVAAALFRYIAVLHHSIQRFRQEYRSTHRLHARLTVSACTLPGLAPPLSPSAPSIGVRGRAACVYADARVRVRAHTGMCDF